LDREGCGPPLVLNSVNSWLARELDKAGILHTYRSDPITNAPRAYIGEAEVIRERLKQHKSKEFWVSAIVFVSKDENLTKAHVRYLESRLLLKRQRSIDSSWSQNQSGGSKLPESDREDMEGLSLAHSSASSPFSAPTSSLRSPNPTQQPSVEACFIAV